MTSSASPGDRRARRSTVVVLTGIDGSGKTTVARALGNLLAPEVPTLVLANYSGRRLIKGWTERLGLTLSPRTLDAVESTIRLFNVVLNQLRARFFDGVVIMDRDLSCQQALRAARGLPPARFLAVLKRLLPAPDVALFLDVSVEEAHRRIARRGTDSETLAHLSAYRDGYLSLPDFARFNRINADGPLLSVLDQVEEQLRPATAGRPQAASRRNQPVPVR
ncbi:AAA family ATPase [Arthrobacter sp. JZ12]|uniref:thymidylate kinase n=1 Tax=Arthrobacter sp. JZ12 TaxID=2654190 RepID=UPI002B45EA63|nr:thymidylate kinase [Arthrobacter sp. JZ12]WRH25993.1 AAA family ATPase [Arthrobacter sp. JZ12]